jgi:hypothetical protein
VASPSEVLEHLVRITPEVIETKLRLMHKVSMRFGFLRRLTEPPNAVNSLLAGMCAKQKQYPPTQLSTG